MNKNRILGAILSFSLLSVLGVTSAVAQTEVEPLLANIKWNQTADWNATIPVDPTTSPAKNAIAMPAGSTAVAMGQVMCYYRWPESGLGAKTSYYHQDTQHEFGLRVDASFADAVYDWSNISETEATDGAAELLYQIGVAANMDWRGDGSYAELSHWPMASYFRYYADPVVYTNDVTNWADMVKAELAAGRPVILSWYNADRKAYTDSWVIDGVNAAGLFHVNKGNSGVGNEYRNLEEDIAGIEEGAALLMGIEPNRDEELGDKIPVATIPDDADPRTSTPMELSELGHLVWLQDQMECRAVTSATVAILAQDIDAAATARWTLAGSRSEAICGFQPIGREDKFLDRFFEGYFNGNAKKISGLTMSTYQPYHGFFGIIGSTGRVKYLGLENVNFISDGMASPVAGPLAAHNKGLIAQCYVTGNVSGWAPGNMSTLPYLSGLVGENKGTVVNTYSQATVNASASFVVGGVVGMCGDDSQLINSYFAGQFLGQAFFTGVTGSIGKNVTVKNSYWDFELSQQFTEDTLRGRTTKQMKTMSNYAQWDFSGCWSMQGYPVLRIFSGEPLGALTVTLSPADAVTSGAQWSVDGGNLWNDSSETIPLPEGAFNLVFKYVDGFVTPEFQEIEIVANEVTVASATYESASGQGALYVTMIPDEALLAGAQWSEDGVNWHDNYNEDDNNFVGTRLGGIYNVTFKDIDGWAKPMDLAEVETTATTELLDNEYMQTAPPSGTLNVRIMPRAAVQQGAQWSVDGMTWYNSGVSVKVDPGAYTIQFKDINGWDAPSASATVEVNSYSEATAVYIATSASVKVNIAPQGAVDDGAQWSIDGGATWNASGTTVTVTSSGLYTLMCRGGLANWIAPADMKLSISLGDNLEITRTYEELTSNITGRIEPVGARMAGAQWRIDDRPWMNSGDTYTKVQPGAYLMQFKDVPGYSTPDDTTVTIVNNTPIEVTGVYQLTDLKGTVTVLLSPEDTLTSAGWRMLGESAWRASGESVSLDMGTYVVEFRNIFDYNTPASQTVYVRGAEDTLIRGIYTLGFGHAKAMLVPANAVNSGAKWSLDFGKSWMDSGVTTTSLNTGSYTVVFKPINGWSAPEPVVIDVTAGQLVSAIGTYVATSEFGSLNVNLKPTTVNSVGGAWTINNGFTWYNSGDVVTQLAPGTYYIEYASVAGWVSPTPGFVTVGGNHMSVINATYTKIPVAFFDIVLNGSSAKTYANYLKTGDQFDFTWNVGVNDVTTLSTWVEIFASKSGGFDLVRMGSTMTGSAKVNGFYLPETTVTSRETLNALPEGKYTMVPSVNRGTLPTPIPEVVYTNNWAPLAGKQLTLKNESASKTELQLVQPVYYVIDPEDATKVNIYGKVLNAGEQPVNKPGFWVEVFYGRLSAEATFDPMGTIAAGQLISTLAPGEMADFNITGTVPGGAVNKALALIIDSTDLVAESNETNNSKIWYHENVLPVASSNVTDLQITSFTVDSTQLAPKTVVPGDKLKVSVRVKNAGNDRPSRTWLELFASQDGGVSFMRGATLTGSKVIVPPAIGQSETYTFELPIRNIGDGIYTVVAMVNRTGVSGNSGDMTPLNNRLPFALGRVFILSPVQAQYNANIVWTDGPNFTQDGKSMTVTGTIINAGIGATGAFWTEAFSGKMESKTGIFSRGRAIADGVYCGGLLPGETKNITITGAVEIGKVVGVLADSTDMVAESDETDNYDYSDLIR